MVDTIVSDSGSVSVGIIAGRTIVTLRSPLGTFGVGGDSARVAAWSDSASEAVGASDWLQTTVTGPDWRRSPTAPPPAPEAIRLIPVAGKDSTGRLSVHYVVYGTNGAWAGAIELSAPAAARLLAALQARHDETHSVGDRPFDASYEFEVERPVQAARGNPAPTFPAELRYAHVPGEVLLQFVVDTTGRPDLSTVRALAYTRPEFARATRAVLPYYRFIPARAGGRLVRQIVQLPFQFSFAY